MDILGSLSRLPAVPEDTRNNSPERVSKAARDFEAILLRSLATEAFASAMVSSGGLGIANMISKQLTRASSK